MENYYGGPKGLQGIQGGQGKQGFNFLIKGIIQDNTCETIDDVFAFVPALTNLPSFEENKWFVYYFNKLKISFGYSKDKNNNIQKIFLGYQHSGFWTDNNIDLLKFSILNESLQENGNINFNFEEFENESIRKKVLNDFYIDLQKYLKKQPVNFNAEVADVNNDGIVNDADKLRFLKYKSDWNVEINPKTQQYLNSQMKKYDLILDYTVNNLNEKIKLLNKYNQNLLTPLNFKENKKGDYYLNVLDKKIDGWIKNPILSNTNVSYYEKNNEVTFSLYVSGCPDFMKDIEETFTVQIGSKFSSIESQSSILQSMDSSAGYYKHETEVPGYLTTIFTINGDTSADVAYKGALTPNDIIDETWYGASFPVVEAH